MLILIWYLIYPRFPPLIKITRRKYSKIKWQTNNAHNAVPINISNLEHTSLLYHQSSIDLYQRIYYLFNFCVYMSSVFVFGSYSTSLWVIWLVIQICWSEHSVCAALGALHAYRLGIPLQWRIISFPTYTKMLTLNGAHPKEIKNESV